MRRPATPSSAHALSRTALRQWQQARRRDVTRSDTQPISALRAACTWHNPRKEKAVYEESKILPHSENNVMVVAEEEKEIQPLWLDNGEHSGNTVIAEKLVQSTSPAAVDGNDEKLQHSIKQEEEK
ncbi:hypothetical protein KIL84_003169 [Mauremys mutica]|uniref:Uncharacterized protein n=1 Tax=Mauremys mutica TaxID=74926 RepID=A0A9D4AT72_9SAUR|nr:hypothetical protein KIL84_003169 [Mauremys mutica]